MRPNPQRVVGAGDPREFRTPCRDSVAGGFACRGSGENLICKRTVASVGLRSLVSRSGGRPVCRRRGIVTTEEKRVGQFRVQPVGPARRP